MAQSRNSFIKNQISRRPARPGRISHRPLPKPPSVARPGGNPQRRQAIQQVVAGGAPTMAPRGRKPIKSPREDSLPPKRIKRLVEKGYKYANGKWWPPGNPNGNKPPKKKRPSPPGRRPWEDKPHLA